MNKKLIFGIIYVSIVVIAWGTFGSLVDYVFLNASLYEASSLGQGLTFFIMGAASTVFAKFLYPKIINISFVSELFELEPKDDQ